eukprot:g18470.t1
MATRRQWDRGQRGSMWDMGMGGFGGMLGAMTGGISSFGGSMYEYDDADYMDDMGTRGLGGAAEESEKRLVHKDFFNDFDDDFDDDDLE